MSEIKIYNGLPVYEVYFDDETEIETISLVKFPANNRMFAAFEEQQARFEVLDEERRIIFGLVMGVGQLILRKRDDDGTEFYAHFSTESIRQMHERFMAHSTTNPLLLAHDINQPVENVYMIESVIKDTSRGIDPKGYEDMGEGSWFASYKVDDPDLWAKIKEGTFRGFSIHGMYGIRQDAAFDEIDELMAEVEDFEKHINF